MSDKSGGRPPKAYANLQFLHSSDARGLRIMAEFLEPLNRFERYQVKNTVVFFGSARIKSPEASREHISGLEARIAAGEEGGTLQAELERARGLGRLARYYDDAMELARRMTLWSKSLGGEGRHYIVASGGGPGIMEAANRGASLANGRSIGLNISIPFEQNPNAFISRELNFEFHYFFMRKFWFVYLAKALIVFPGGFGTLDEMMEVLTLVQTQKLSRPLPIVVFGKEYWNDIFNFDAMAKWGTISPEDLKLLHFSDTVDDAMEYLQSRLEAGYAAGHEERGKNKQYLFPGAGNGSAK